MPLALPCAVAVAFVLAIAPHLLRCHRLPPRAVCCQAVVNGIIMRHLKGVFVRKEVLLGTLTTILKDNWEWRKQISRLAVFELVKKSRGAVLSWAWFFIKPAMYIFCFWFALEIGLRVGSSQGDAGAPPYILWLCAGLIPWFFMQDMLGAGIDVMHRYPYLVNKIKFPLSGISTIYTSATMLVQLMLMCALFVIYFACGMPVDIYLLQVPILLVLMFVFWDLVSILFSPLSALSKDVKNLMNAFSTPLFWLSGVLFDIKQVPFDWIQTVLAFNPITFFVTSFRDAFYSKCWFWDDPMLLGGFVVVFVVTLVLAVLVYKKLNEEVADVL